MNDLTGLGKLAEVAKDLGLELAKPKQIIRVAKAEAEALKIKAVAEVDAEALALVRRAEYRRMFVEARRQKNLEAIFSEAAPLLPEIAEGPPVDPDWANQFASFAQDVGDTEMRSLWARLLAGEVEHSGRFSRRTLQIVSVLSRHDADLFTRFCALTWTLGDGRLYHMMLPVQSTSEEYLGRFGLTDPDISHLATIGLVITEIDNRAYAADPGGERFQYFGQAWRCVPRDAQNPHVGVIRLTAVGAELAPISGAEPRPDYCEACLASMRLSWRVGPADA